MQLPRSYHAATTQLPRSYHAATMQLPCSCQPTSPPAWRQSLVRVRVAATVQLPCSYHTATMQLPTHLALGWRLSLVRVRGAERARRLAHPQAVVQQLRAFNSIQFIDFIQ
jgi:hypothetical protein